MDEIITISMIARAFGVDMPAPGNQINVPGPHHSNADRSLSIRIDPSVPDGFLVNSFAGDDPIECKDYVRKMLGLSEWKPNGGRGPLIVAEYIYEQADGTKFLRVQRTRDKKFWQSRWNGKAWVKGKPRAPKIPYRLPALVEADEVFV